MTSTSAIATGHANREITLDVRRGSFLASLDRTALARPPWCARSRPSCCLRLGEIRVFNRDAFFEPMVVKALLVIIPQEASLYWNLSVWQHLRIFGKLHGLTKGDAHRRANELIDILHLEEPRDKTPAALSGGLRRRVLVGIATLTRPPVIVFDESTVGLAPSRAAICGLTASLSREEVRLSSCQSTTWWKRKPFAIALVSSTEDYSSYSTPSPISEPPTACSSMSPSRDRKDWAKSKQSTDLRR